MGQSLSCLSADGPVLLTAATNGDRHQVRQILVDNPQLAGFVPWNGQRNCLHCAAASGHAGILEEILSILTSDARGQQGSEARRLVYKNVLNQQASKGRTPLVLA
ncbi:TPA: hypothetical protein ACH3X3_011370 [Trebouxia sp. C0006]